MYNSKITVISGAVILALIVLAAIVLGNGKGISLIKYGVAQSIEEDFKIKESLGKLFFAQKDDESVQASGSVTISSFTSPVKNGEFTLMETAGDKYLEIRVKRFSVLVASAEGYVEALDGDRAVVRHPDGKKSVYQGVKPLVRLGDKVEKGESLCYAVSDKVVFRLYEDMAALDPFEYIAF